MENKVKQFSNYKLKTDLGDRLRKPNINGPQHLKQKTKGGYRSRNDNRLCLLQKQKKYPKNGTWSLEEDDGKAKYYQNPMIITGLCDSICLVQNKRRQRSGFGG